MNLHMFSRSMTRNSTFPLAGILEKDKLHESGTNFVNRHRNVRIVLKGCKKDYVLEATLGDSPDDNATEEAMNFFYQCSDDCCSVCHACCDGTRTSKEV